jgi:hypothetical protein
MILVDLMVNSYLTNYGQKKSINNSQDLDLSAASQHSIGRQPIQLVIFRKTLFLAIFIYL